MTVTPPPPVAVEVAVLLPGPPQPSGGQLVCGRKICTSVALSSVPKSRSLEVPISTCPLIGSTHANSLGSPS